MQVDIFLSVDDIGLVIEAELLQFLYRILEQTKLHVWSAIQRGQESKIASRSTDMNSERGIEGWALKEPRDEPKKDLAWMDPQTNIIDKDEPYCQVVIK